MNTLDSQSIETLPKAYRSMLSLPISELQQEQERASAEIMKIIEYKIQQENHISQMIQEMQQGKIHENVGEQENWTLMIGATTEKQYESVRRWDEQHIPTLLLRRDCIYRIQDALYPHMYTSETGNSYYDMYLISTKNAIRGKIMDFQKEGCCPWDERLFLMKYKKEVDDIEGIYIEYVQQNTTLRQVCDISAYEKSLSSLRCVCAYFVYRYEWLYLDLLYAEYKNTKYSRQPWVVQFLDQTIPLEHVERSKYASVEK